MFENVSIIMSLPRVPFKWFLISLVLARSTVVARPSSPSFWILWSPFQKHREFFWTCLASIRWMARERCCVTSSHGNLSYIMLYSLSIFIAYFYLPVSLSQVGVTNIGRAQVILQEDLRFKLNVKNAGKKIACATICHSKGEANYVSSTLATKLFSMARAGEFQISAFPDFDSALNELKQFQRSP